MRKSTTYSKGADKIKLGNSHIQALNFIKKHGTIHRYKGGFWAERNAKMEDMKDGKRVLWTQPKSSFSEKTIHELVSLGEIIPCRHEVFQGVKRVIECKLKVDEG